MVNTELSVTKSTMTRQAAVPAPGRFDAAVEERLDREATAHVEDNRPQATRDGYAADWKAWLRFCAEADLPPAAVRSGTLVAFVEWCWHQPARPPKPGAAQVGRRSGRSPRPRRAAGRQAGVVADLRDELVGLQEDTHVHHDGMPVRTLSPAANGGDLAGCPSCR